MTETDTIDITTRSQYQTRDNESLPRTAEERRWIHVYLRSPASGPQTRAAGLVVVRYAGVETNGLDRAAK